MIPPSEIPKNRFRNLFRFAFSLVNKTEELGNTVHGWKTGIFSRIPYHGWGIVHKFLYRAPPYG